MTGSIFLGSTSYSVNEAAGSLSVVIRRTGDTSGPVNVTYSTTGSTATAGQDFVLTNGVVNIAAGATQATISLPILDDAIAEATETLGFSIVGIDSGSLFVPRTANIRILDNENPVTDPVDPPLVSPYNVTQQTVATGLDLPISMVFSPGNPDLMYIAEKGGAIKVFNTATQTLVSTFVDLSAVTNNSIDRGLLDIVLDPNFPTRPYLYAFYTVDPPETVGLTGNQARDGAGNRYGHVVRLEADPATGFTTILPGSERRILVGSGADSIFDIAGNGAVDSGSDFSLPASDVDPVTGLFKQNYIKVDSSTHMGGSLEFGPDGKLYVSVGDGASYDAPDPRALPSLDVNSLTGKVLRIDPDTGNGFADNPFASGPSYAQNNDKVWYLGLRNPYAMAIDSTGKVWVSETGWFSWEEINSGPAGSNFGWPYFEGADNGQLNQAIGYNQFPSAAAYYAAVNAGTIEVAPAIRAFSHLAADPGYQIQGIVGSDVIYTGNAYPGGLQNSYFFTDFATGNVFALNTNDPTDVKYLYTTGTGFGPVHFEQGPDGKIYYADIIFGTIGKLDITGTAPAFRINGNASAAAANAWQLTAPTALQNGSVMSLQRIDLSASFDMTFRFNVGNVDSGADGFAFVLHNAPTGASAIGAAGGGLGAYGIARGLGIEFDIFSNGAGDLANDHTQVFDTDAAVSAVTTAVDLGNLENGLWHTASVHWNGATLSYTVDGNAIASLTRDLSATYLGGSRFAHFGFTGATGGLFANQNVEILSLDATAESGVHLSLGGAVNVPPVGVADAYNATAGQTLNVSALTGVLANDTDANGDVLTAQLVTAPTHGTLTLAANGGFIYTPTAGYVGADSFQYRGFDGIATGAPTTVALTVSNPGSGTAPTFTLNGNASTVAANSWQLTAPSALQNGSVMAQQRIDLNAAFDMTFRFNVGNIDSGADGMAFVLHNAPTGANALGAVGGGLGAYGITRGLGIELDIYNNGVGDIANDHTQLFDTDASASAVTTPFDLGNLENGAWHTVAVHWSGTALSYTVDGNAIASITSNLSTTYLGGSRYAYFGFTGATGGLSANQNVEILSLDATAEGGAHLTLGGAANVPPVGVADAYNATAGQTLNVSALTGVLANDTDANGDPLTAQLVTAPTHGTLTLAANGGFIYTPTAGYVGADSFQYRGFDGIATGAPTTVALTVSNPGSGTAPTFTLNGNASTVAANSWQLTAPSALQNGSVMAQQRIDLSADFDMTFRFNVGNIDSGADGMAFVLHNAPTGANALGAVGGGLGAYGITRGLGIEFDIYNNGAGDIANDHTQIFDTDAAVSAVTTAADLGNLENGLWHTASVHWDGAALSYTVDGNAIASITSNLSATYFGGSQFAYFGFTGATGGLFANQNVEILSLSATAENGSQLLI